MELFKYNYSVISLVIFVSVLYYIPTAVGYRKCGHHKTLYSNQRPFFNWLTQKTLFPTSDYNNYKPIQRYIPKRDPKSSHPFLEILPTIKNITKTFVKNCCLMKVIKNIIQNKFIKSAATTSNLPSYSNVQHTYNNNMHRTPNSKPTITGSQPFTTSQHQPISKENHYSYNIRNYVNHHHHHYYYYGHPNTNKGHGESIDIVTLKPDIDKGDSIDIVTLKPENSINNDSLKPIKPKNNDWFNGVKLSRLI